MTRFVFILSPERSGSTLLSAALGGHPQVAAPPELHLLRYPDVTTWRSAYPAAAPSLDALFRLAGVDPPHDLEERQSVDLYRHIAEAAGVDWIVDKTPAYARSEDALARARELEPVYLWLLRHPLGVAASRLQTRARMRREANAAGPWARIKYPAFLAREALRRRSGAAVRELAHDWGRVHRRIAGFLADVPASRQLRVSFESLVANPEPTLKRICERLELEPVPAMLDPRANLDANLAWGVGDQKIREQAGFVAMAADAWRTRIDPAQLPREIEELYRELTTD